MVERIKVNLSNEYGSIGEKVAEKWLREKGYEVYSFQEILWKFSELRMVRNRLNRRRKKEYAESDRLRINQREKVLADIFGERLEDMKKFEIAVRRLAREEKETRLVRHYGRVGIGPDLIVKKNGEIIFIEVKVNQSQPKKYQKSTFEIAKDHGFKTMILNVNVDIQIQKEIQLTVSG